jgi:hypothetical protein
VSAGILRGARAASKNGEQRRALPIGAGSCRALAAREGSSAELVDLAIAQIEAQHGSSMPWVVRDFERAKLAAAEVDKALAR